MAVLICRNKKGHEQKTKEINLTFSTPFHSPSIAAKSSAPSLTQLILMRVVLRPVSGVPRDKDEEDQSGENGRTCNNKRQQIVASLLQDIVGRTRRIHVLGLHKVDAELEAQRIHFGHRVAAQGLGEETGRKLLPQ